MQMTKLKKTVGQTLSFPAKDNVPGTRRRGYTGRNIENHRVRRGLSEGRKTVVNCTDHHKNWEKDCNIEVDFEVQLHIPCKNAGKCKSLEMGNMGNLKNITFQVQNFNI